MTCTRMTLKYLNGVFVGMFNRCYRPKHTTYYRYGGRGVIICDEWLKDKNEFINWALASGYKHGLQLDRIDNNGPYSPSNCQWISKKENLRKTSRTVYVDYMGERKPLIEWCEIFGFSYSKTMQRLSAGWDVDKMFSPFHNTKSSIARKSIKELGRQLDNMVVFYQPKKFQSNYEDNPSL